MTDDQIADALDRWAEKHGDDARGHGLEPDDVYRAAHALRLKKQLVEALEKVERDGYMCRCPGCKEWPHADGCALSAALNAAKETP